VRVPAENLLGEVGKGHRIAFNVLNVGRFKLAAAALGAMKPALAIASAYAHDREAFGRPIERFPLIAAKLAGMAARTYAVESTVYRIAGLIDARLAEAGMDLGGAGDPDGVRTALEELAVECSIAKVLASEALDAVVDELVQVHGGYGYIEDYPAARAYRDSRINRIWEGTNEINRLLIPGTLLKRALTGRLDLLGPARRAQELLLAGPGAGPGSGDGSGDAPGGRPFAAERAVVDATRQVTLLLAGAAVQRFGTALDEEQELLAGLADLAIDLFAMESAVVRAEAAQGAAGRGGTGQGETGQGETSPSAAGQGRASRGEILADLARLVVVERIGPVELTARTLAARVAEGDDARLLQAGIRRLFRGDPVDAIACGRRVAEHVTRSGGYPV